MEYLGEQESGIRSQGSGVGSLSVSPSLPLSLSPSPALATCKDRVKARTRQFARRQETWFRSLSECTLVPMQAAAEPVAVAEAILAMSTTISPAPAPTDPASVER